MQSDTYDSMYLWGQVHDTPEQYTKHFKRTGGFEGTAIDPTYLVMRATELWGPIGGEWGYEIVDEAYIDGAPMIVTLSDGSPQVVGHHVIHKIRLRLTYPIQNGVGVTTAVGHIEQFGQTEFVGTNSKGYFTDEEHAKKSLTDALSKCLSLLGFGADVRIGKFEDSVYAQEQASAVQAQTSTPDAITEAQKKEITDKLAAMRREWVKLAALCTTTFGHEVKEITDLTSEEATKTLAFLQGKVTS